MTIAHLVFGTLDPLLLSFLPSCLHSQKPQNPPPTFVLSYIVDNANENLLNKKLYNVIHFNLHNTLYSLLFLIILY